MAAGMVGSESQVEKKTPIDIQFTTLDDNTSKLHELLQSLGVRLEPVISACPATEGKDVEPTGSPLLERLISITNSVRSANQKIEQMLSTLQI